MTFVSAGRTTTQPAIAEFQIGDANHPILIPAEWKGKKGYFILDTGSATSLLDTFAFNDLKECNQKIEVLTPSGEQEQELYEPPDLAIGPINLRDSVMVGLVDFTEWNHRIGKPIYGCLGATALMKFVLQIDFDNRVVRLFSPNYDAHPDWGREFGFQGVGGVPAIMVRLSDGEYPFRLDTGFLGEDIAMPMVGFNRALASMRATPITDGALTFAGYTTVRYMRWPVFPALGWNYRNLILQDTEGNSGAFGLSFLSRHMITFDFPRYIFYAKAGLQFDRQSELDMSGLTIERVASHVVGTVTEGSPAYQAGIRDGDVILSVDGKAAKDWDICNLSAFLRSQDGREISVSFWRDGETQNVTFKLRRRL